MHHRDPFDRLHIAQCLVEGLRKVTHDGDIAKYDVPLVRT
jgi:PIN domain nuclease of toxin-antitoxin system